jgi:uncharacterized protein (DUF433 family)
MASLLDRISIDPNVCFGKPCIEGTRIWVSLVLDFLASGETRERILAIYPQLTDEDIRAAIACGAEVARERVIPVPVAPKCRLDETLGDLGRDLPTASGHDVSTCFHRRHARADEEKRGRGAAPAVEGNRACGCAGLGAASKSWNVHDVKEHGRQGHPRRRRTGSWDGRARMHMRCRHMN